MLLFIEETPEGLKRITGMMIDPKEFVYRILSPKIQEIAQREFVISVFNRAENFQFNSSRDFKVGEVQQSKSLWIFPNYQIGISLVGQTIEDLVQQRALTNILLIGLLTIVLILGVWIVYRNIKKEVELAQIKSDFVSNVSHELRTPLSLISMFSETLEMDRIKTEEKKKEYYSIISQEANRLSKIVNSILNFSKMEAGKRQFNFVESYLNDVAENVYRSYKFSLEQKGFTFNIVKDESIPIIKIDEEAVSEAIVNLVDNSVKYSSEKKEITIRTGIENNCAYVEVEDKGIGIPAKDQKKIFDKFFRVSSGDVHNAKGSGLGLSIVKYIMDAHKGSIELSSEINKGSKFRLLFQIS
jgi:two-component system phosphate regulon sensor histidine kinase PhoR